MSVYEYVCMCAAYVYVHRRIVHVLATHMYVNYVGACMHMEEGSACQNVCIMRV